MIQKHINIIIQLVLLFTILFGFNITTLAAQKGNDYKMPFRAGEIWKNDVDHGIHTDKTGVAIDFYPTGNSTWEILAPAAGTITRGCTANDVTYLALVTNAGDTFRFVHLDASTVTIQQGFQKQVVQGETLGKISTAKVAEDGTCFLSSELPHVHFSFLNDACPLKIDGYEFSCDGLAPCGDQNIYAVYCNKTFLGATFKSTNTPVSINSTPVDNNYCESLKNKSFAAGENSPVIVGLQKCLKAAGLFDWSAGFTGYYGNYTSTKFQEWTKNNKPTTGVLEASIPKPSTDRACDLFKTTSFNLGDKGDQVTELQKCLKAAGLFDWPAGFTGYYGSYTSGKVKEWKNSFDKVSANLMTVQSTVVQNTDCASLPYQRWTFGQKDSDVIKLQDCMTSLGYFKHPNGSTGYFGEVTRLSFNNWVNDVNSKKK